MKGHHKELFNGGLPGGFLIIVQKSHVIPRTNGFYHMKDLSTQRRDELNEFICDYLAENKPL